MLAVVAWLVTDDRMGGVESTADVLLLALGLGVAFVPSDVPGFSEPRGMGGDGGSGSDMQMMP